MQHIFKLSRVEGIFVFVLRARCRSKIPGDMYMVSAYGAVQWSECSIYVSVYSFPKLTSLPAGWLAGGGTEAPLTLFFGTFLELF